VTTDQTIPPVERREIKIKSPKGLRLSRTSSDIVYETDLGGEQSGMVVHRCRELSHTLVNALLFHCQTSLE
jgi:hypothetical protein